MSDSTEGDPSKLDPAAASGGGMGLAPEDAERFAAAFVPSWQFEPGRSEDTSQAPMPFGGLSSAEIEQLSNPGLVAPSMLAAPPVPQGLGTDGALTTAYVDASALAAPAPPPAAAAAVRQTLLMHGAPVTAQPSVAEQPQEKPARSQPAPSSPPQSNPRKTKSARPEPVVQAPAPAVPQSARARSPERGSRNEDTARIPLKKSGLSGVGGVVIGGVVGLLILAGIVGSRALSGPEPAASIAPPPPPRTPDTAVPPPPPPTTEVTAAQPPAPSTPAQDTRVKPGPAAVTAPPPPPPQPAPQQTAKAPAPAWHPPPHPAPKNPTKPGGGGIVRDNPF